MCASNGASPIPGRGTPVSPTASHWAEAEYTHDGDLTAGVDVLTDVVARMAESPCG